MVLSLPRGALSHQNDHTTRISQQQERDKISYNIVKNLRGSEKPHSIDYLLYMGGAKNLKGELGVVVHTLISTLGRQS
jgi:hypothetical protein